MRTKKWFIRVWITLSMCTCLVEAAPLSIAPDHPNLRYVGRFSEDYQFGWTGSQIEIEFEGTSIESTLKLTAGKNAGLTIVVDGTPSFLLIQPDQTTYSLAKGLAPDQRHRIVLFKRSEGSKGAVQFNGFQLSEGAKLFSPTHPKRKILVIGDSITCGYGNEATTIEEGNSVQNENGYMSYAAIAARNLEADVMMICWSGRGMIRNYGKTDQAYGAYPTLFNRALPMQDKPEWDHFRFIPDVVVINLGTNDMNTNGGKEPLDKTAFMAAYTAFIARVRTFAPKAPFILSIGPMATAPVSDWLRELVAEEANSSALVFSPFDGPEEIGGHWHPSVKKDKKMAKKLVPQIQSVTGWTSLKDKPLDEH